MSGEKIDATDTADREIAITRVFNDKDERMADRNRFDGNDTDAKDAPLVIERTFDAAVDRVWQAITERSLMKQWYFDLAEFKPEPGFEFQFYGGTEERRYLHLCKVVGVIPLKKITYSWRYDGYEGNSFVTFELFDEGMKTRLKLTHEGLGSFPKSNPDLARGNFVEGWTSLIGTSLKEFLETDRLDPDGRSNTKS